MSATDFNLTAGGRPVYQALGKGGGGGGSATDLNLTAGGRPLYQAVGVGH